eukprot:1190731-Prorocentrum_minimum.AAC.1
MGLVTWPAINTERPGDNDDGMQARKSLLSNPASLKPPAIAKSQPIPISALDAQCGLAQWAAYDSSDRWKTSQAVLINRTSEPGDPSGSFSKSAGERDGSGSGSLPSGYSPHLTMRFARIFPNRISSGAQNWGFRVWETKLRGESNSTVVEWLNKGLTAAWSPTCVCSTRSFRPASRTPFRLAHRSTSARRHEASDINEETLAVSTSSRFQTGWRRPVLWCGRAPDRREFTRNREAFTGTHRNSQGIESHPEPSSGSTFTPAPQVSAAVIGSRPEYIPPRPT